jgi:RHS repeat-associated protein
VPSITRKTDKGLPRYTDAEESDVFILSGVEDLVPVLKNGKHHDAADPSNAYIVRRYRPRSEGLFARIERWTSKTDPQDIRWRSISRDNVTSWYGKTSESRIADPADKTRIFSWLICESYDDKGNAAVYQYKTENSDGVDLSQAHERTRGDRSANCYLKRIKYGNQVSRLVAGDLSQARWFFEVVCDYGEHDLDDPLPGREVNRWICRRDAFSSHRSTFECRTYRLLQRIFTLHHFKDEAEIGENCLVRSIDLSYRSTRGVAEDAKLGNPVASFLASITQHGYSRRPGGGYVRRSLPPLEFEYSEANVDETVREIDPASLENLPQGLDGGLYRWVDLDGEGVPGVFTEQADGWFYKRNFSPRSVGAGRTPQVELARLERVAPRPNLSVAQGSAQFMDLAGDGRLDLAVLEGPMPGYYERTDDEQWQSFHAFLYRLNVSPRDPNLRFVDLSGDGHADALLTEDDVFTWYPSVGEEGFSPPQRVAKVFDEQDGPALVFADGTQSIYLADMNGDGLSDLVRIRNGEVCYWSNRGYGRFGPKVAMDDPPSFDTPDRFDQERVRLADIDGSGNVDIIYLGGDGVDLYFNQSGNRWSARRQLRNLPTITDLGGATTVDLLGNGTACLVWSSSLPGNAGRQMRYVDLMAGRKPHLLTKSTNNLGAETLIEYAPSTKFYLEDKLAERPWLTRLPFPVQVVERVQVYDRISRNRFVTRYAYHHGYFDGEEREFRGFGMVEQRDTEELAALSKDAAFANAANLDASSNVPPVLTKTWFHTGAYFERGKISRQFESEYYREGDDSSVKPGLRDVQLEAMLLDDTLFPDELWLEDGTRIPHTLSPGEEREACRALKGSILRQEIYALDGSEAEDRPYSVSERNYTIELLQERGPNPHAVFLTHARETVDFHYERRLYKVIGERLVDNQENPPGDAEDVGDPRVSHSLTLEVDRFGNVRRSVAVGYGRRFDDFALQPDDRDKQRKTWITCTESSYTNAVPEDDGYSENYRAPLPSETRTYELLNVLPKSDEARITNLFRWQELVDKVAAAKDGRHEVLYEDVEGQAATTAQPHRRLIECVRTQYRRDDLTGLLPLGELDPMALAGESYRLAFTPGLLAQIYRRDGEDLLPDPAAVLAGTGANRGGYVSFSFDRGGEAHWWIPSGRVYYSEDAAHELQNARAHFYLPRLFEDPFEQPTAIRYDGYDLLLRQTEDAVHNTVAAENDYRVLQPWRVTDPNGNPVDVVFDALGMVFATAVRGGGDNLDGIAGDIDVAAFRESPHAHAKALLGNATTRIVYDVLCYLNEPDPANKPPVYVATLARETHLADPLPQAGLKIRMEFSYSDGFGREVQKKIPAEPGLAPERDPDTWEIVPDSNGRPRLTHNDVRWVGSGWTVFNNKGKPVRQYEPFFSDTHHFEVNAEFGVSPILFYDPPGRVVATLRPNHTWEKVVFDPWRQETWDVNDTLLLDPRSDENVKGFFVDGDGAARLPVDDYEPSWYSDRMARQPGDPEREAATRTQAHAGTPAVVHMDSLGRAVLAIADNGEDADGVPQMYATRTGYDVEGKPLYIVDAKNRVGMDYRIKLRSGRFVTGYDVAGNQLYQNSIDAGERWILNDASDKPLRRWDSRNHRFEHVYDELRRPTEIWVHGGDGDHPLRNMYEKLVYGEDAPFGDVGNRALGLRGRLYEHYDTAGRVRFELYDFKGNLNASIRRLARRYKEVPDWSGVDPEGPLEIESFSTQSEYDALNRVTTNKTPDNSVTRPAYNEANLLEAVTVERKGTTTPFITDINYNEKGQRLDITYGNGVKTEYDYEPDTFRLERIHTFNDGKPLQDFNYTYDPAGNITQIRDAAQPTIFFDNMQIDAVNEYTYDPLYRLVEAKGREHRGQLDFGREDNWNDAGFSKQYSASDPMAWRAYTETYEYDEVGNIGPVGHQAGAGTWTRTYDYNNENNRLLSTTATVPGTAGQRYEYKHHPTHGFITYMPHLALMAWNFRDELTAVARQSRNDGGTAETTYYVYDSSGQRVRKVTEDAVARPEDATVSKERICLDGAEVYRERAGMNPGLERWTLHVMDDKQRVAMVETRNDIDDGTPKVLKRYQHSNHLGSACLETGDSGRVISYEEYHPYGTTAYQANDKDIGATAKSYRYSGKERDEESGFSYHRSRYYLPWLGRWTKCDGAGAIDGTNLYAYVRNNPARFNDANGSAAEDVLKVAEENIHQLEQTEYPFALNISAAKLKDIKSGKKDFYLSLPVKPSIDEPLAVGAKGISVTEARARALDVMNRTFEELMTNTRTKYLGDASGSSGPFKAPISVIEDPSAIFTRRFGEVDELRAIFDEAVAAVEDPKAVTPVELKKQINANVWDIIKTGTSEAANRVRDSFAEMGYENRPGLGYIAGSRGATKTLASASEAALGVEAAAQIDAAGAEAPSLLSRGAAAGSAAVGRAAGVLEVVGKVVTIYGAAMTGDRVTRETGNTLFGMVSALAAIPAGAVDDAMAANPALVGLVTDAWESKGAGPVQAAIGDAVIEYDRWGRSVFGRWW